MKWTANHNLQTLPLRRNTSAQEHRLWYKQRDLVQVELPGMVPPFQWLLNKGEQLVGVSIENLDTNASTNVLAAMQSGGLEVVLNASPDYDLLRYPSTLVVPGMPTAPGRYFVKLTTSEGVHASEPWAVEVQDETLYHELITLEYWHRGVIRAPKGGIHYEPPYKSRIRFRGELTAPEYTAEEKVQRRLGKDYAQMRSSSKEFGWNALLPEHIADALRAVRLHSDVEVKHRGETYTCESFNMEVNSWEGGQSFANTRFSFIADTVVVEVARAQGPSVPYAPEPGSCIEYTWNVEAIIDEFGPEFVGRYLNVDGQQVPMQAGDIVGVRSVTTLLVNVYIVGASSYNLQAGAAGYTLYSTREAVYLTYNSAGGGYEAPRIVTIQWLSAGVYRIEGLSLGEAQEQVYVSATAGQPGNLQETFTGGSLALGIEFEAEPGQFVEVAFVTAGCGEVVRSQQVAVPAQPPQPQGGIGFMQIGTSFVVS